MQIDAIELFHVALPLKSPWRTAYGEDQTVETVLIKAESAELTAWAESCPLAGPTYSPEWAGGVFVCLRDWLVPAVLGEWIETGEALQSRLNRFRGNPFAKAAVDNVWWTLRAQRRQLPLHVLLGGTREEVLVGADFGVMDSIEQLLTAVGRAVADGYQRIKLKYRPGWDLTMLRAVRQEFPTERLHIDCNGAYTLDDLDMFCRLDDFSLEMIEQPLTPEDLIDHARLQETIRTPLCLDESIFSLARAQEALDLGSCRYMNLKPGRVGGLTVAKAIHEACAAANVPCWVGGMLETAIGARTNIALATLAECSYPADIFPSERFYAVDLGHPEVRLDKTADGSPMVKPLNTPGTGAAPDEKLLEHYLVAHCRLPN